MNEQPPPYSEAEFCGAKRVNVARQQPYFATSFETDFCDVGRPDSTGFARRLKTYRF
jgi:hypothetical protein